MLKNSPDFNAKEASKNKYQYFNDKENTKIRLHNYAKTDLKNAIEREEFFLCYQPIFDTKTKKMVSMEALIRWKHPVMGVINPREFIPIAEETKLINPLGEWVINTSCRQLRAWHEIGFTQCSLSINISVIQLQQKDFAKNVKEILDKTRFNPKYLELEIIESISIDSNHLVKSNIAKLKELSVKISFDDFGTGYNCLSNLQSLAIDCLKIDRTFILNIKSHVNSAIVDAIITLGHRIDAKITAEGVEEEEQYEYLKEKGCDMIQGYYFSKPLLPEEVVEFFNKH